MNLPKNFIEKSILSLSPNAYRVLVQMLKYSNNPGLIGLVNCGPETKILIPGGVTDEVLYARVERKLWSGADHLTSNQFLTALEEVVSLPFVARTPRVLEEDGVTTDIKATYLQPKTKWINKLELSFMTKKELAKHITR